MIEPTTLNEILTYSNQFEWETLGVIVFGDFITFIVTLIGVVIGGVFAAAGILSLFDSENDMGGMGVIVGVAGSCILMTIGVYHYTEYDKLTPESYTAYEAEEAKWEREMATPFIENLPVVSHTDIAIVEYNYGLEVENESGSDSAIKNNSGKNAIPIKVVLETGEVLEMWANVAPLKEGMTAAKLEYKSLEKELIFHERSNVFKEKGYFDVTLYTDEKL